MFAMILIVSSLGQVASAASKEVTVTVDAKKVNFPDGKPLLEKSRVLIPVRFVSEALGAKVDYKNRTVLIKQNAKNISMKVNTSIVTSGEKRIFLDVPARLQKGRVYVPLRFVSEALGAQVDWNSKKYLVTITTAGTTATLEDPKDPEQKPEEPKKNEDTTNTGYFKDFEWEKKTDLGKSLFKNNIKFANGKVTFSVPENSTATFFGNGKTTKLTPGKTYSYPYGVGGLTFSKIYAKEDHIENYALYLDNKSQGLSGAYSDSTEPIVEHTVFKNNKVIETAATLTKVITAAQSL
ncbi:hypothetical protein D3C74_102360 [compost metagenome]